MRSQATNSATHDLGFVIGTSAGRGAVLDPSATARTSYELTVLTAARTLATRWNPAAEAVHSATYDGRWGVIIDSAMNMQLLFHAARIAADPAEAQRLREIARAHLGTLARDFLRSDGSAVHRIAYDVTSGRPSGVLPGQGYSQATTWSRGQAWAIYGFAAGYQQTRDEQLLTAARRAADYWLARATPECVPQWDFDAPPELPQKDSSAAAIAAAGLLDLARLDPDPAGSARYRASALALLFRLTSRDYTTAGTVHPAILRRASYSIPQSATEGSYIWGDHYLLEAMTKALRVLRVAPRLSLASPATTSYAVPVRVVPRATLPGGEPAPAVPLRLEWRADASTPWVTVAAGVTGRAGTVDLTFRPVTSGWLRVVSDPVAGPAQRVAGYDAAASAARRVEVAVSGRLLVSVRGPSSYVMTVPRRALPAGTVLTLQERRVGRWVDVRVISRVPATTTRERQRRARYFRVLPAVPAGLRSLPSPVIRVPAI